MSYNFFDVGLEKPSVNRVSHVRKDQASLLDIDQLLEDDCHTKMTNYIWQFLWRDLTSGLDIVDPYFTSGDVVSAKFISACVFDCFRLV